MTKTQKVMRFDRHLDLDPGDVATARAIIFHGASGSGKSSYIDHLLHTAPALAGRPFERISGGPIDWRGVAAPASEIVVVDELLVPGDLRRVAGLLTRGHRVIAASHLAPWQTACLSLRWKTRQYATDRAPAKIERHLASKGVCFSRQTVAEFCRRFGATYTDADIILEHAGGDDFDKAYRSFMKRCDLRRDQVTPSFSFRSVLEVVYWNTRRSSG